jgi:hypothetical protein
MGSSMTNPLSACRTFEIFGLLSPGNFGAELEFYLKLL